jgi:putative transposase
MKDDRDRHRQRSIRLRDFDYSRAGYYYVTICTFDDECLFGLVVNGQIELNTLGNIVKMELMKTAQVRDNVILDAFVIMPNHIHAIIILNADADSMRKRGTARRAPTKTHKTHPYERFGKPVVGSLPTVIRSFKSAVTKHINELRHTPGIPVWQRGYFEHVIRNDSDLRRIREYIVTNPLKWELDAKPSRCRR